MRAERARRSLHRFVREAWRIVEPGTRFIDNWHIEAICEHLEAVTDGRILRLLINVPPGHMKSLIVSVFWPAWEWAARPEERSLFASYAADLAIRDSVKCRAIIDSEWYRKHYATDWELSSDQNVKSYFQNTRMGFRAALGVGGKTTGFRGDKIVVDDPLNAMDAFSEAARKSSIRWFTQAYSSRLNDKRTGKQVVIMQRLHEEDLAGYLLQQGDWEHLCLPTRYVPKRKSRTSIGWEDPRQKEGDLLFPEMFPADVVDRIEKKELGSAGFAGQHQQAPAPAEGAIFKEAWFRRWTKATLPPRLDWLLLSWDFTFKDTEGTDYVSGGIFGGVGADVYLLHRVRERMDFVRTLKAVESLREVALRNWGHLVSPGYIPTVLYEDKANGPAVKSALRSRVPGLVPFDPGDRSKVARAYAVSPLVEAGNFHVPADAPWVEEYLQEILTFPSGAHDDQVDMTTQALLRMSGGTDWAPPLSNDKKPRALEL